MPTQRQRERIAYHEAGHAVVGVCMGFGVVSATIMEDKTRGTITWYSAGHTEFSIPLPMRTPTTSRKDCRKAAIVLLAGEAAQRKFSPRSVRKVHIEGDRFNLDNTVSRFEIPALLKRTIELVEKHWPMIETMASELLKHGTIYLKR
jgi:hypothetical protein